MNLVRLAPFVIGGSLLGSLSWRAGCAEMANWGWQDKSRASCGHGLAGFLRVCAYGIAGICHIICADKPGFTPFLYGIAPRGR